MTDIDTMETLATRILDEARIAHLQDRPWFALGNTEAENLARAHLAACAELRLLRAVADAAREVVELYAFSPPGSCVRALDAALAALVSP